MAQSGFSRPLAGGILTYVIHIHHLGADPASRIFIHSDKYGYRLDDTLCRGKTDFQVDEIPAYEPSGIGDHVYFLIEKRGLATARAVRDIARALRVRPRDIGVAGLQDARGVTRQMLSLEHADPGQIEALQLPRISVLRVSRHRNKLRMGHLLGNRFTIKVRDTDLSHVADLRKRAEILVRRGVPNYYGSQRFGNRGDTWQVGRELLLDNLKKSVSCGRTPPDWWHDVRKAEDSQQAERDRQRSGRSQGTSAVLAASRRAFEHVREALFQQLRAAGLDEKSALREATRRAQQADASPSRKGAAAPVVAGTILASLPIKRT